MQVSVVVPNYNYAKYIKRRLNSVLSQSHPIDELIILDDCSTDNSVELFEREIAIIRKKFPKLKIITDFSVKNSGNVCAQWAKGFKLATNNYVWIAEMDDLAEVDFLEKVIRPFSDNEDVLLSYSDSKMVTPGGKAVLKRNLRRAIDKIRYNHWRSSYINDGKKELAEVACIYNTIPNVSAVVFKKQDFFMTTLGEAKNFKIAGDWYFYVQIMMNGKVAYINQRLNKYCIHDDSVTKTVKKQEYLDETRKIHKIIAKSVNLPPKSRSRMIAQEKYLANGFGLY